MKSEVLKLYNMAKNLTHETFIENIYQSKGSYELETSNNYKKHNRYIKLKLLFSKIFYAVIFGILPVIPLFAYFEFFDLLTGGGVEVEVIIFTMSLLFGIYFALQFFNFFLMAMIDVGVIMSGKVFQWLETLPISHKKLRKLLYMTIFRNFDLPIIVIILAFPITMFYGTQNFLIFIVSFGISVLCAFFSINVLILIGQKLNRVLNINDVNSRRTILIRLFNIFTYSFMVIGSIYLIQWVSSSINVFYELIINSDYPLIINLIISIIPFPLTIGYLISILFVPNQISLLMWFSTLIGLAFFIIINYMLYTKTLKAIDTVTFSKKQDISKKSNEKTQHQVKITTRSSFIAFLRKDLITATRDLKTFLAMLMPIILSITYTVFLNVNNIGVGLSLERQFFMIFVAMLTIQPIISGILVYSLLNLEDTGRSILNGLPIFPREQAKAKLLLLFLIQTLASISPILLFIHNPRFPIISLSIILTLPYVWFFLLLTFLLRIYFFGKRKKSYVIAIFSAKNRTFKWIMTFILPYVVFIWVFSFSLNFYRDWNFTSLFVFLFIIALTGYLFVLFSFDSMFPILREKEKIFGYSEDKNIKRATIFSRNIWLSIIVLLILFFLFSLLTSGIENFLTQLYTINWYPYYVEDYSIFNELFKVLFLLVPVVIYSFLYLFIVPKILGIPYGKQNISLYLRDIGLGWLKSLIKYSKWIFVAIISVIFFYYLYFNAIIVNDIYPFSIPIIPIFIDLTYYTLVYYFIVLLLSEILFHGLILTLLLKKYSKKSALILYLVVFLLFNYLSITFYVPYHIFYPELDLVKIMIYQAVIEFISASLFIKTRSILFVLILNYLMLLLGILPAVISVGIFPIIRNL